MSCSRSSHKIGGHSQLRISKSVNYGEGCHHYTSEGHFSREPGQMSAKDLTGAPLISYAQNKNRKVRRTRTFQPLEKKMSEPLAAFDKEDQFDSHYYTGHNLYQNKHNKHWNLQDFYQNPTFGKHYEKNIQCIKPAKRYDLKHTSAMSKSIDHLSDTYSVTSDEADNFKPRIIKPRRRRKKEKRRVFSVNGSTVSQDVEDVDTLCPVSGKQWLPTGLLSAESESCGDSEEVRSESDQETTSSASSSSVSSQKKHRKLAATLSVPAYSSYNSFGELSSVGSDYYSQVSPNSVSSGSEIFRSSPTNSDSDSNHQSFTYDRNNISTSCSYFRSPKLSPKAAKSNYQERARLRKTNSWAYPTASGEFSLFSPQNNNDLLSGIRKTLSKIDINEETN